MLVFWMLCLSTFCKNLQNVDPDIYKALGIAKSHWILNLKNLGSQDILDYAEKHLTVDNKGYELPDAVVTEVWAISGAIGKTALENKIADKIADVKNYNYSVVNGNSTIGGNFNYTYTVSISTYTKTVNSTGIGSVVGGSHWGTGAVAGGSVSAENPSVTFVAVQVVRTATHQ